MSATEFAGVYYCTKHAGVCNEDSSVCDFAKSHTQNPELGDTETCSSCDKQIEFFNDGDEDLWVHAGNNLSQCDPADPGGVYAEPTDACILHACYYDPAVTL